MKQKGFAPIIIIILIALGAVSYFGYKYYQLNHTPPPASISTANWKTYTNTKYQYLFKYPSAWAAVDYDPKNPELITDGDIWLINKPEYLSKISEYSYTKNDFSSIFFSLTKYDKEYLVGGKKIIYRKGMNLKEFVISRTGASESEIKNYELDTKSAIVRICQRADNPCKQIFVPTTLGILEISYKYGQTDLNKNSVETIFNEILSTFKFTK